jgi:predicted O-methyltransferase YrrM
MPRYTANYAKPYLSTWQRLFFNHYKWTPAKRTIVEIGSYEGSSALWFAEHLLDADGVIYCIDPWSDSEERYRLYCANVAESAHRGKIRTMRARSFDALRDLLAQGVVADLVYIDGSHAATDVLCDLVLGFRLARTGGVVLCDDYTWEDPRFGGDDIVGRPKIAIDAFTTIYSRKIRLVRGLPLLQIAFEKISE